MTPDMELNAILDAVREPEPADERFVASVMTRVGSETHATVRPLRRRLRRPTVAGVAAAIIVTGGTVAALVSTERTRTDPTPAPERSALAITAEEPSRAPALPPRTDAATSGPSAAVAAPASKRPSGSGYASEHSSYIVDAKTGLALQTETYTNTFEVGEPHRITLTLENTGRDPIAISGSEGCALQVMAYGEDEPDSSLLDQPEARFEWACAGSDADPRVRHTGDTYVLRPGERKVADAYIVLPVAGDWQVSGMCRCDYKRVKPTPVPRSDPLTDITRRALPAPLLGDQPDGQGLVTPPIGIRAD